MIALLRRYFEENRRVLSVLAAVLVGNVAFALLVTGPARLRGRLLAGDLEASERELRSALGEYGRAYFEAQLYSSAQARMQELYDQTLLLGKDRYPTVDAKIKELTQRFRLAPQSIGYDYDDLVPERLERLQVSFQLKGTYDNLRRFLEAVEGAEDEQGRDAFFAIDEVALTDSTESGTELNLSIAVATYFHKPELAALDREARSRPRSAR